MCFKIKVSTISCKFSAKATDTRQKRIANRKSQLNQENGTGNRRNDGFGLWKGKTPKKKNGQHDYFIDNLPAECRQLITHASAVLKYGYVMDVFILRRRRIYFNHPMPLLDMRRNGREI